MGDNFKKLMRKQVEKNLKKITAFSQKPAPKSGWIRTIRDALSMTSSDLADRLGCTRSNVSLLEQREAKGTISLHTLQEVARALNCKLVYALVPLESFEVTLEKQARLVAKQRIMLLNQSMKLEQQGLSATELKKQEDDLVEQLLAGNLKDLWKDDEI